MEITFDDRLNYEEVDYLTAAKALEDGAEVYLVTEGESSYLKRIESLIGTNIYCRSSLENGWRWTTFSVNCLRFEENKRFIVTKK